MRLTYSILMITFLVFFSCKKTEDDTSQATVIDESIVINSANLNDYKESLKGITTINGDVEINDINFLYPAFMSDVETITGDLTIRNNESMESLEGLEKLRSVRSLKIFSNNVLANLEAIRELEISQDLIIGNTTATDIPELDVDMLAGKVDILSNNNLVSLTFLENLVSADKLTVKDNEVLPNFDGLEKLTQVEGVTNISNNMNPSQLLQMRNVKVWVLRDGVEIEVMVSALQEEDTVVFHQGVTVTLEGMVVEGMGEVRQFSLEKKMKTIPKKNGDRVFPFTLLESGCLYVSPA